MTKYYKAFNPNLKCLDFQFEIGKEYSAEGEIRLCKNGFHCCENILYCLKYYPIMDCETRFCEVEIGDEFITDGYKTVTKTIKIIRELVGEELASLLTGRLEFENETITYFEGHLHSFDDQPAISHINGYKAWFNKGVRYRDGDKPSEIHEDGTQIWHNKDGKVYRGGDKPAKIQSCGTRIWYNEDGNIHRDGDKPAIIYENGDQVWFHCGGIHRKDDKPAKITNIGDRCWYIDGLISRMDDKPSIVNANGDQFWYIRGINRREDNKPSVIYANGKMVWTDRYGMIVKTLNPDKFSVRHENFTYAILGSMAFALLTIAINKLK